MKLKIALLIIFALGVIVYSNSLGNDFVWDDESFVINNEYIRSLKNIPLYFTDYKALAAGSLAGENYRPMAILLYAVDHHFWGLDPMGYHITNIALHIINAFLVFYLIQFITKDRFIGLFSSLIFLLHPVQVEAVTWISGRSNVLFLLFYLISFACYARGREKGGRWYFLSLLAFALSLLSREMAVSLPFILILYDLLYNKDRKILPEEKGARYGPYFFVLLGYLAIRFLVISRVAQCGWWTGEMYSTFLTMITGIGHYIKVLLCPTNLCADHLMFPAAVSFTDLNVMFSGIAVLFLIFLGIVSFKWSRHVTFGIFWFFITLGPVLNIIPIKIPIAERFLYLPIIGYALVVSVIFRAIVIMSRRNVFLRNIFIAAQIILLVFYAGMTMSRNNVWADEIVFYKEIINKYPDNCRARNNLSVAYMRRNSDMKNAYDQVNIVLEIDPDNYKAHKLLSDYYIKMGRYKKAKEEIEYLLKKDDGDQELYLRLANIYIAGGNYDKAEDVYFKLLKVNDLDVFSAAGKAGVYMLKREYTEALDEYSKVLSMTGARKEKGISSSIYLMMGDIYALLGLKKEADLVWNNVEIKFPDQFMPVYIAALMKGDVSTQEFLQEIRNWTPDMSAAAFYFLALKRYMDGDTAEAAYYYKRSGDVKNSSAIFIKRLAVERLKDITGR